MTDRTPQAVESCHDLLLWMIPQIDRFPRIRRHSLGAHLEQALLDVLEQLVAAAWSRNRRSLLTAANQKLGVAQHLWRLSMELQLVSRRRFRHGSERMLDVGRQMGGWIKASN